MTARSSKVSQKTPRKRRSSAPSPQTVEGPGVAENESAFRAIFVGHLRKNANNYIQFMLEQVQTHIPEYRKIRGSLLADVKRSVSLIYAITLNILETGRRLSPDEVQTISQSGASRSEFGLPLFALEQGSIKAIESVWSKAREYAEQIPAAESVARKSLSALGSDYGYLISEIPLVLRNGWYQNHYSKDGSPPRDHLDFYRDVISGKATSPGELRLVEQRLGHDLSSWQELILMGSHKEEARELIAASSLIVAKIPAALDVDMCDDRFPHHALVVPERVWIRGRDEVKEILTRYCVVALIAGQSISGDLLARAYADNLDLVRLALAQGRVNCLLRSEDLLLEWYLEKSSPERAEVLIRSIEPLLSHPDKDELVEALEAELGKESQAEAAKRLNTTKRHFIRKRDQAAHLIGLKIRSLPDRHRAYAALILDRLQSQR
jgi:hypothetical protein